MLPGKSNKGRGQMLRQGKRIAEENDAAMTPTRCEDQLSKVLIFRHENAIIVTSQRNDFGVSRAEAVFRDRQHIPARLTEGTQEDGVETLVDKKAHAAVSGLHQAKAAGTVSSWAMSSAAYCAAARMASWVSCG